VVAEFADRFVLEVGRPEGTHDCRANCQTDRAEDKRLPFNALVSDDCAFAEALPRIGEAFVEPSGALLDTADMATEAALPPVTQGSFRLTCSGEALHVTEPRGRADCNGECALA